MNSNPYIYKHSDVDAPLWDAVIRWIIEQVNALDFGIRDIDETCDVERPHVECRGEA